jgi:hypothetical protein
MEMMICSLVVLFYGFIFLGSDDILCSGTTMGVTMTPSDVHRTLHSDVPTFGSDGYFKILKTFFKSFGTGRNPYQLSWSKAYILAQKLASLFE